MHLITKQARYLNDTYIQIAIQLKAIYNSGGSWLSKYLRPGPSAEQSLFLPHPSDLVSETLTSYYDWHIRRHEFDFVFGEKIAFSQNDRWGPAKARPQLPHMTSRHWAINFSLPRSVR